MLDLRIPTGSFFTILGLILLFIGITDPTTHAALTTVNVDLYCGILMLAFGLFLLGLARRASRKES